MKQNLFVAIKKSLVFLAGLTTILTLFSNAGAAEVGVLITEWGQPNRYVFEYCWNNTYWCRVGDITEYEGQPCKIGHNGAFFEGFSYMSHMGYMPWQLAHLTPGYEYFYDRAGFYKYDDVTNTYISINPHQPPLLPADIPPTAQIIPAVEVEDVMAGTLQFPPDPRTGVDLLEGWYKIESASMNDHNFSNGLGDVYEQSNMVLMYYYLLMGMPTEPWTAAEIGDDVALIGADRFDLTIAMLENAFGDAIDVRIGYYTAVPGFNQHETDVAEEFANDGYRKLLISRETTDNNNLANDSYTGYYIKERLCELGVLDETEMHQVRQIGRTPEYNSMNVKLLKPYIEAYPEGSTIAMIYVTHGLPWPGILNYGFMSVQYPWWKDVFHENAYLNYLSWKEALEREFGDKYNLVFNRNESDLLLDNFYAYGFFGPADLDGKFYTLREPIQMAKEQNIDKIIIVPGHWHSDAQDTVYLMRKYSNLPMTPMADIQAGKFDLTFCEDAGDNQTDCNSGEAVAEITITNGYNDLPEEFATAYFVRLMGGLERFGLYPNDVQLDDTVSKAITKLDGGTVEVTDPASEIKGAKIVIPADPYPDYPQGFDTPDEAIPFNDPSNTFECMWEDNIFTIAHRINPPETSDPINMVGPAVHFGPYRTIFNRDVTITIPYNSSLANDKKLGVYIFNHLTENWDLIEIESAENGLATFKTMVLGLFRVGKKEFENVCPARLLYGESSREVELLRTVRDNLLSKTPSGQLMIQLYYQWSPVIVAAMQEDEEFKEGVKKIINSFLPLFGGTQE